MGKSERKGREEREIMGRTKKKKLLYDLIIDLIITTVARNLRTRIM
jgi:hypothetical protein